MLTNVCSQLAKLPFASTIPDQLIDIFTKRNGNFLIWSVSLIDHNIGRPQSSLKLFASMANHFLSKATICIVVHKDQSHAITTISAVTRPSSSKNFLTSNGSAICTRSSYQIPRSPMHITSLSHNPRQLQKMSLRTLAYLIVSGYSTSRSP